MFRRSILIFVSMFLGGAALAQEDGYATVGDVLAKVFNGGTSEMGGQLVKFSKFNSCSEGKYVLVIDFNDKGKVHVEFDKNFTGDTFDGKIADGIKAGDVMYIQMYAAMIFVQDAAKHLSDGGKIHNDRAQARAETICSPEEFANVKNYVLSHFSKQVPQ